MEKSFGVICEGPSDYRIIKRILSCFFKGKEPFITCYQPKLLPNGKSDYGGWPMVLENCSNDTLKEIFEFNNYAIIQIDTDCSPDKPFDVPHVNENGKEKDFEQLYNDVITKIDSLILQPEIKNKKQNIIFAICIHSIECWLLPILYNDKKNEKVNNCLEGVNAAVQKKYKKMVILKKKNKNEPNGIKVYDKVISEWNRKDDIIVSATHNFGFRNFIESLVELEADED
jgi:hypothetical protein